MKRQEKEEKKEKGGKEISRVMDITMESNQSVNGQRKAQEGNTFIDVQKY